jgi:hypothetical protein
LSGAGVPRFAAPYGSRRRPGPAAGGVRYRPAIKQTHAATAARGAASNFYAELYTRKVLESRHQNGITFLEKNVASTLSESERAMCDQPLSEKELTKALDMLPVRCLE